jgi:hypothetical protein
MSAKIIAYDVDKDFKDAERRCQEAAAEYTKLLAEKDKLSKALQCSHEDHTVIPGSDDTVYICHTCRYHPPRSN